MSNLDDLTTLETRITAAKAEASKAEGAIAQLEAQGEKEFGVKTLEEAKALEAELTETVADFVAEDAPRFVGSEPPIVLRSSTTVPNTVPPHAAVTPAVMIAMTDSRQAQPDIAEVRTSESTP